MDTSCLRLKFTPLLKNVCKSDSKCCLEIVPEVSCIQNLDKIQWQHGDDSIEYMIPITYKVILKKKHKKNVPKVSFDGQIKTYHSCVDLVPSFIDVTTSDVAKVLSDSLILFKHPDNMEAKTVEEISSSDTENRILNEERVTEIKHIEPISTKKINKKEIKDIGTQFLENLQSNVFQYKKIFLSDKMTSAPFASDWSNNLTSTDVTSWNGTFDWDSSTAVKVDRKLSITPIWSVNTEDNILNPGKAMPSNFIIFRVKEPKKFNINHKGTIDKFQAPSVTHGLNVIKKINDQSYETLTNNSSERILPEVRVSQFMKMVEKELMPLKKTLNDMIQKCALLGYICRENGNPMIFDCKSRNNNYIITDTKSNRVFYSMVFDREMARNEAAGRIIDSLSFEVEAVQQDFLEVSGTSKSTPLNLKIKVRKKDEASFKQGVVSVPKLGQPNKSPDKIRLVNSDRTVLSFQVFVDTEPEKKPEKKRKKFFGGCLSSEDNDGDSYTESDNKPTNSSAPAKLNFGLSKNVQDMQLQTRKPIMFFGNACKPGGCLDPAFDEDKYTYEPTAHNAITSENNTELPNDETTDKNSRVESLDKKASNEEFNNETSKLIGTCPKSAQSIGVMSMTSFRGINESHFSLTKSIAEKILPTQTENIIEEQTPDDEKVLTKLYPEENDSTFQSKTNSSIQDIKGNEESLVTTVVAVGGALTAPLLLAGAATQLTTSREDARNAEKETGVTPISTIENINFLKSGANPSPTSGISINSDKVLNSSTFKSEEAFEISKTTDRDYETMDKTIESSGDENIFQSDEDTLINNLSDVNELSKKEENDAKSKASNEIIQTSYDGGLTQEPKNSEDIFQSHYFEIYPQNDVQDLVKAETESENITVIESQDQPTDGLAMNVDNINENPDVVDKEDENILLKSQQSKTSDVDTHGADEKNNNSDLQQKEDSDKLNSRVHDTKNLKVDFIDENKHDVNNDIAKFKYKHQPSDSILSSGDNDIAKLKGDSILNAQDGSKFILKKDVINMNLAFQSYTNDQNESVIKSLDNIKDIKRQPQDNVTIIKSQLQIDAPNMIKVPIDTRNYMMLEVKASGPQIPHELSRTTEEAESRRSDNKEKVSKASSEQSNITNKTDLESFQNLLSAVYDQQLIPLQRLISELKKDVDLLASEQLWLKENSRKMKKPTFKLIHSSRKCGCSKKYSKTE